MPPPREFPILDRHFLTSLSSGISRNPAHSPVLLHTAKPDCVAVCRSYIRSRKDPGPTYCACSHALRKALVAHALGVDRPRHKLAAVSATDTAPACAAVVAAAKERERLLAPLVHAVRGKAPGRRVAGLLCVVENDSGSARMPEK